jgi:hypothetical protein
MTTALLRRTKKNGQAKGAEGINERREQHYRGNQSAQDIENVKNEIPCQKRR